MSNVFVIDTLKQPLNPVHPGRARLLLTQGKAAVFRRFPFTIILKTAIEQPEIAPLRVKIDPGSNVTGLAVVNDTGGEVVFAAELTHRGHAIKKRLDDRRAVRRSRRHRKTRYRPSRFRNRRRPESWLPPSLESRIANVLTWVNRLRRFCPITAISMELVKFDMQKIEKPEIAGIEYQQGTLHGYEVKEYLLQKWDRSCTYCGVKDVPLQVEHIHPRANGGTDRVSNLCLACEPCNQKKGAQDIRVFLQEKPELVERIAAQASASLKDASAVNTTRWTLYQWLKTTGLPIECGSGGLTKFNRTLKGLSKRHWVDAANVGRSTPETLQVNGVVPLLITAKGHGRRQLCVTDAFGFPRQHKARQKRFMGYQTGDMVKAMIPTGKHQGVYVGRIAIRHRPNFRLGNVDVHPKYLRAVYRADGYEYIQKGETAFPLVP